VEAFVRAALLRQGVLLGAGCGTGKTMTLAMLATALTCGSALIVMPFRALLESASADWTRVRIPHKVVAEGEPMEPPSSGGGASGRCILCTPEGALARNLFDRLPALVVVDEVHAGFGFRGPVMTALDAAMRSGAGVVAASGTLPPAMCDALDALGAARWPRRRLHRVGVEPQLRLPPHVAIRLAPPSAAQPGASHPLQRFAHDVMAWAGADPAPRGTLVVGPTREFASGLAAILQAELGDADDVCVEVVTAEEQHRLTVARVEGLRAWVGAGKKFFMVATTTAVEGLNVPGADLVAVCGSTPLSAVQYVQLVGRVGRDGAPAACVVRADPQRPQRAPPDGLRVLSGLVALSPPLVEALTAVAGVGHLDLRPGRCARLQLVEAASGGGAVARCGAPCAACQAAPAATPQGGGLPRALSGALPGALPLRATATAPRGGAAVPLPPPGADSASEERARALVRRHATEHADTTCFCGFVLSGTGGGVCFPNRCRLAPPVAAKAKCAQCLDSAERHVVAAVLGARDERCALVRADDPRAAALRPCQWCLLPGAASEAHPSGACRGPPGSVRSILMDVFVHLAAFEGLVQRLGLPRVPASFPEFFTAVVYHTTPRGVARVWVALDAWLQRRGGRLPCGCTV
jgi:hypothetical protein